MKPLGAALSIIAIFALGAPLVVCAAADAKTRTSKARTAKAVPLPDRNPTRAAAAKPSGSEVVPSEAPKSTAEDSSDQPEKAPTATAAVSESEPSGPAVPLPDANPDRSGTAENVASEPAKSSPSAPARNTDFAAILKPLLDYELSASDAANLKEAFRASARGNDNAAHAAIRKIKDKSAAKFATWFEYRNGSLNEAEKIEEFRLANPDWPSQTELRQRAEIALFLRNASPERVRSFFANSTPLTGAGKAALASVYMKENNEAAARELIVSAWRDNQVNLAVEKRILDRFGSLLSAEDHRTRIDKLLFPDSKSSAEAALRISKLLPADERKKIAARVAIVKRGSNVSKLLDALPASATAGDVGLLYNRIQWLRRKERDEEAWKMLLDAPSEPAELIDVEGWWTERRLNCRRALNQNKYRIAYDIAANHGPLSGDAYIEANFLAGWIALRFLSEPQTALRHFQALRAAAKGSKDISLAEYWLGRTALAVGDNGLAYVHFHAAAKYPQHYYGQLGRQALDPRPANLSVTPTPTPTDAEIQSFLAHDAVRSVGIALASGMERVTPQFFIALARSLNKPGELVLLAELAKRSGNNQIAIRLAKIAFNRDMPMGAYALPIGVLPEIKSLMPDRVEPALVHALSRQESEFNASAKSPVGASGLMQLMPGTAKAVARQYKVKYQPSQLTNAAYNVQLGEAFLRDLIESYSGSYFLALAAYNAGGGRVQSWMRAFGDPRHADVDPVDWVERIPFTETREYVKKILESLQLYRSRLEGSEHALQLVQDLNRGRATRSSDTAVAVQASSE